MSTPCFLMSIRRIKTSVRLLAESIDNLPEKERLVISLYYHEGLTMKEIGKVIGVTESRVCQLHSKAIIRLRVMMNNEALI